MASSTTLELLRKAIEELLVLTQSMYTKHRLKLCLLLAHFRQQVMMESTVSAQIQLNKLAIQCITLL